MAKIPAITAAASKPMFLIVALPDSSGECNRPQKNIEPSTQNKITVHTDTSTKFLGRAIAARAFLTGTVKPYVFNSIPTRSICGVQAMPGVGPVQDAAVRCYQLISYQDRGDDESVG